MRQAVTRLAPRTLISVENPTLSVDNSTKPWRTRPQSRFGERVTLGADWILATMGKRYSAHSLHREIAGAYLHLGSGIIAIPGYGAAETFSPQSTALL